MSEYKNLPFPSESTFKVALVVMPFAAANRPSLAAGLLQAGLKRDGIFCTTKYFSLLLEKLIGPETYDAMAHGTGMTPLAGEWVFSQLFYAGACSDWQSYEREVLEDPCWGLLPADREPICKTLEIAPSFLQQAYASDDWSTYDLVGFTSTFEQTMPSLCLAQRIRESHPDVLLAFGGANFEGEMGRPYIEEFEMIDFVSTGEADVSFPALCRVLANVKAGRAERVEVPPGFLYRDDGAVHEEVRDRQVFVDLDALPTPDYGEYFADADMRDDGERAWLPIEASRGCWWGQKAHCTFCGLNGAGMTYRQKSWRRVAEEADELVDRHGSRYLQFADNILSMGYFKNLLPFWAERGGPTEKFFEIKSNLRREQVELMRAAGIVSVQAGVESLTDTTLRLMRKGVSGAQNVALLRWCVESGIQPQWNVLYGFPNERLEDYQDNLNVLRKLTHLPPPSGFGIIRLDRFSPNYTQWREHGFTSISPMPAYRHTFPFADDVLNRLAYYFDYDHPQKDAAFRGGLLLTRFGQEWRRACPAEDGLQGAGELAVRRHWQGGFVLVDRRFNFPRNALRLRDIQLGLLLACDAPTSRERALSRTTEGWPTDDAEHALDTLLERAAIAKVGKSLVTLALLPPKRHLESATTWRHAPAVPFDRAS